MTPRELNIHMLNRLLEAMGMLTQMNISIGLMTKVVNDLLPLVTDVNKANEIKRNLEDLSKHYQSSQNFGKVLLDEMRKIKSMTNFKFHKQSRPLITNCCKSLQWVEATSPDTQKVAGTVCYQCGKVKPNNLHRITLEEYRVLFRRPEITRREFNNLYS